MHTLRALFTTPSPTWRDDLSAMLSVTAPEQDFWTGNVGAHTVTVFVSPHPLEEDIITQGARNNLLETTAGLERALSCNSHAVITTTDPSHAARVALAQLALLFDPTTLVWEDGAYITTPTLDAILEGTLPMEAATCCVAGWEDEHDIGFYSVGSAALGGTLLTQTQHALDSKAYTEDLLRFTTVLTHLSTIGFQAIVLPDPIRGPGLQVEATPPFFTLAPVPYT